MIDTDKYYGHTPAPWDELLSVGVEDQEGWDALLELGFNDEARLLIADAPLLLAEIKRLRKLMCTVWDKAQWCNHELIEMDEALSYIACLLKGEEM